MEGPLSAAGEVAASGGRKSYLLVGGKKSTAATVFNDPCQAGLCICLSVGGKGWGLGTLQE